ncbi:MAG: glycosyltransferase family 2 protein [Pelagimonas sp.]|jgi:hypothetical protein|nr:glycosyltransferase family 2 protein [Pelagimonas sp.]
MRILCVTSVKNEAPYLLEWIAHHQALGVSDFLVYSNDCHDGTHEMLQALHDHGVLCHVSQEVAPGISPQWQALKAAWKHPLRKACDWALVIDCDEFVALKQASTLPDMIGRLPGDLDALAMPWRFFGASGAIWAQDGPTLQRFTRSASEHCLYPIAATFFKTLFRLQGPFQQFGVHRPRQKSADKARLPVWYDGAGRALPDSFAGAQNRLSLLGQRIGRDLIELNHYSLRSVQEFTVKRGRGLPNRTEKALDLSYWAERNFNTVENTAILRHWPATAAALASLTALPGMAEMHQSALNWHQTAFEAQIKDPQEQRLFSRLSVAGDSRELPPDAVRRLIQSYQAADQGAL